MNESGNAKNIRVRFAPSPTGTLHLGSARTALFNYLYARRYGGSFILRVEDTDIQRSSPELEKAITDDLTGIGITWDEGPEIGGEFGPYRQSERFEIYREQAEKLIDKELAYYCYCTPEQLEEDKKTMLAAGQMPKYSGQCRRLSKEEAKVSEIQPAVRFIIPDYNTEFEDLIRGAIKIENSVIGDFVIIKSDGSPTYNFAAAIDDWMMGISHVVRGEDHLTNTARQVYLYNALGASPPQFTHVGMILGTDRSKLSKRHGAESIGSYIEKGFLPEAIVNYLSLLGWSDKDSREIFKNIDEIAERFDAKRLSPSPSMFDIGKFTWLNGEHIRSLEDKELTSRCMPFLSREGLQAPSYLTSNKEIGSWIELLTISFKDNLQILSDIVELAKPYYSEDMPDFTEFAKELVEPATEVVRYVIQKVDIVTDLDLDAANIIIKELRDHFKAQGYKPKDFFHPLRVALIARHAGPPIPNIMALLGKARVLDRLNYVLKNILHL